MNKTDTFVYNGHTFNTYVYVDQETEIPKYSAEVVNEDESITTKQSFTSEDDAIKWAMNIIKKKRATANGE